MFSFLRRLWRSLSGGAKGGWLIVGAGLWPGMRWFAEWVADKVYGDAVFAWLVAELTAMLGAGWRDVLWTWGPSLLLTVAGLVFIARDARRAKPGPGRNIGGVALPLAPPIDRSTSPTPAAADPGPVLVGQRLYVGRVDVDANRLGSDFLVEFAFVAFNGDPSSLRLSGLCGRIAYGKAIAAPDADLAPLPTPAIRDDNPAVFTPSSEFLVVVSQSVPGALAAEMARDLSKGDPVVFVLEGLDILLADHGGAEVRLPVWDRATVESCGGRTITGRLAMMRAHVRLG